jgi:hypothetical protein
MSRELKHLFASRKADNLLSYKGTTGLTVTSTRFEVISTFRQPVFWRNALGITLTEAPASSPNAPEGFYVNVEYEFEQGVKIDARELLNDLRLPENSPVRKELYTALQGLNQLPQWGAQRNFKYTVGITKEELDAASGVVYLRDLDLVVGYEKYREEALHPYTNAGVLGMLSDTVDMAQAGFSQRYIFVDNNQSLNSRWINTGFEVFELKAIRDPQLENGVYVLVKDQSHSEARTIHYDLETAEKELGLYINRVQAETFGRPDKRFEVELKEREQDLAREKVEFSERKATLDRQKADIVADRERLDQEIKDEDHRRKLEQQRWDEQVRRAQDRADREREAWKAEQDTFTFERKRRSEREQFEYEDRSRDRKDQSEYFKASMDVAKAVLGILSVGLSIYAVMQKSKK